MHGLSLTDHADGASKRASDRRGPVWLLLLLLLLCAVAGRRREEGESGARSLLYLRRRRTDQENRWTGIRLPVTASTSSPVIPGNASQFQLFSVPILHIPFSSVNVSFISHSAGLIAAAHIVSSVPSARIGSRWTGPDVLPAPGGQRVDQSSVRSPHSAALVQTPCRAMTHSRS